MGKALELVERMYATWDRDVEELAASYDEVFAEDLDLWNTMGAFRGRDEVLGFWRAFSAAFPDARHQILAAVEDGGMLAVQGVLTGTHGGPLPLPDGTEVPATGRRMECPYAHFVWLDGNRITKMRVYFDTATVMAQLGLMPEPATA